MWKSRIHQAHRLPSVVAGMLFFAASVFGHVATLSQEVPRFRSGIEAARLWVSVVDRQGHPVHGLKAEDFEIRVDRQDQPVMSLSEVVVQEPDPSAAGWTREMPRDVATNSLSDARLFILVMDDALTPVDPWIVGNAKAIARHFIAGLAPSDRASVVFTWDNSHSQDLTSDHAALSRAIDRFSAGSTGSPLANEYSRSTVIRAVQALSQFPQFKSAVVLLSVGTSPDRTTLDRIFARGRIPIYAVDIAGLGPLPDRTGRLAAGARRGGDSLKSLSEQSGAFAITDTNDPLPGIDRILRENSSYYVLAYRPLYPADGKYRSLRVRAKWPGAEVISSVRAVSSGDARVTSDTVSPLTRALQNIVPDADMDLRVQVVPFASERGTASDRRAGPVIVTLGIRPPALRPNSPPDSFDVATRVFDGEGLHEVSAGRRTVIAPAPTADSGAHPAFEVVSRIDLAPGRYNLRLAVRSASTGTTASVYTGVVVPDFGNAPLAMSGIVMHEDPAVPAVSDGTFESVSPITPTTERAFRRGQSITGFLRIYRSADLASADVALSVRIIDEHDAAVFEKIQSMAAPRFAAPGWSVDYPFELPSGRLVSGAYLLRIEAKCRDTSVTSGVRFQIQ